MLFFASLSFRNLSLHLHLLPKLLLSKILYTLKFQCAYKLAGFLRYPTYIHSSNVFNNVQWKKHWTKKKILTFRTYTILSPPLEYSNHIKFQRLLLDGTWETSLLMKQTMQAISGNPSDYTWYVVEIDLTHNFLSTWSQHTQRQLKYSTGSTPLTVKLK